MSEPEGGSDVRNLRTRARRDGDDWVIDGHKIWIGNGGIANVHVVNATVDPELGHRGQALFIVPGGTPGLELVRKLDKLGCRASHTAELTFDGCPRAGREPARRRRPARARGRQEAATAERRSATLGAFEQTRPMVAAQALGIARAALEYATTYATEREAFGGPIIDKQGISFPLADLAAELDAARLLTWRASWMAAQRVAVPARARARCPSCARPRSPSGSTERAVQAAAAGATSPTMPVEKWYRDAKLYTIFEGTSEIQRMVIGRALADAAGEPPLHHRGPDATLALGRTLGRGTPARSRAGMAGLKMAERTPRPVLRLAMKVLQPPKRAPRSKPAGREDGAAPR